MAFTALKKHNKEKIWWLTGKGLIFDDLDHQQAAISLKKPFKSLFYLSQGVQFQVWRYSSVGKGPEWSLVHFLVPHKVGFINHACESHYVKSGHKRIRSSRSLLALGEIT